ncbi:MAG: glycosyltransferase, partial [Candidatus Lokiarchaeota archaeon]|nr:glycosyltransferase [Candidatus Lokiarchaeota archaeon]
MNILMLSERFFPEIGGVEKHTLEISKRIIQEGHNLTIITNKPNDLIDNLELDKRIMVCRIAYKNFILNWLKLLFFPYFLKKLKYYDIIHCHDFVTFYWILPFILINRNIYITFHGYETFPIPKIYVLMRKLAE